MNYIRRFLAKLFLNTKYDYCGTHNLLERLFDIKINITKKQEECYITKGSILSHCNNNSTVWGTGFNKSDDMIIQQKRYIVFVDH